MGEICALTDLPRELREYGISITYNAAWRAATEGRIPADRFGGRWVIQRTDLPTIAAAFAPADQ